MSARGALRIAAIAAAAAIAGSTLGACELILSGSIGDRKLDPHVSCESGECVCAGGFGDCDGDVDNGCETSLDTPDNCGACGATCDNGACVDGACACAAGFVDCDGLVFNGCESRPDSDPKNCGACGHDCAGGECQGGVCQIATIAQITGAESLAYHPFELYVGSCGDPAIVSVYDTGGKPMPAVMASGCAHAIAFSGTSIVWTGDQAILAAPIHALTAPVTIASGSPSRVLAATSSIVYWGDAGGSLLRAPASGGSTAETIATGAITALAIDEVNAYWSDAKGLHVVQHTATAASDVSAAAHAVALAIANNTLYAADEAGIEAFPIGGGAPSLVADAKQVGAIAVDDAHVYFATGDGTLRRAARDGGEVTVLATGQGFVAGAPLALDTRAVYWLAAGELRKIAK